MLNLGNDVTAVKNVLTADALPTIQLTASKAEATVFAFLTRRVDIFGAKISVSKALVKYGAVAVLALGLFGTQVYVWEQHKEFASLTDGRVGTVEAYQKETDTNFVNVNAAIIATNKVVSGVNTSLNAKVDALAAKVAADEAKLTPVRPTTAVTRKYYRKK